MEFKEFFECLDAAKVDLLVYGQCVIAISPDAPPRHIPLNEFFEEKKEKP